MTGRELERWKAANSAKAMLAAVERRLAGDVEALRRLRSMSLDELRVMVQLERRARYPQAQCPSGAHVDRGTVAS